MQPSQYDIQREVEALRDLRRRSTTPGALTIDLDLPNQSAQSSPTSTYWSGDGDASSSTSHSLDTSASSNDSSQDPSHLFWVPASVHPEIAPAEFRQFLQEHARSPSSDSSSLDRSLSASSGLSGLGRKKSMLSRQYKPSENDGVDTVREEKIVPLRRNRTSMHGHPGPQLTISDLQKLEAEASASDDPNQLRQMLRRSFSLNVSPTALNAMDNIPEMGDEADSPIIVPPPGQILRRAARTKIRKNSLPGDGGGHRFGASRRGTGRTGRGRESVEKRTSSDRSSSDHSEATTEASSSRRTTGNKFSVDETQRDSFSEESSIFDAYVRDDDDTEFERASSPPQQQTPIIREPPQSPPSSGPLQLDFTENSSQFSLVEALGSNVQQPQPRHLLSPQIAMDEQQQQPPSRTPSPTTSDTHTPTPASPPESTETPTPTITPIQTPPQVQHHTSPPPSPPTLPKSKDKKGLFGKWGKSSSKDKDKDRTADKAEKERDPGFFGSIFGGGKKIKEAEAPSAADSARGREAAQALLGQSRAHQASPPNAPGVDNWSRYPIHVERAIYRLSHIKLANPRRPLYEQVLISNLMFWYLGVINKAQANGEQERREREQKERMEREEAESREAESQSQVVADPAQAGKRETSPRRGPLTRPPPSGVGSGAGNARRAEMAVKGPSYEMQHRVMEQEYGSSPQQQQGQRNGGYPKQSTPPQMQQQQDRHRNEDQQQYFYSSGENQRLPPGAMAPADWSPQPHSRGSPSPSGGGNKSANSPSRSLSANAVQSSSAQQMNGSARKNRSAYAGGAPSRPRSTEEHNSPQNHHGHSQSYGGSSQSYDQGTQGQAASAEEEDLPLAVWQQQRRR